MRGSTTWMLAISLSLGAIVAPSAAARNYPDHEMTPGVKNPDVKQSNIKQTICKARWTETIRPPSSYTTPLKRRQIDDYGYADKTMKHYEEDHLISLQLGGHPTSEKNLWPQPYNLPCGARIKDKIETRLKRMVCSGKMKLATAQKLIAEDWIAAYVKYYDPEGCNVVDEDDESNDDE